MGECLGLAAAMLVIWAIVPFTCVALFTSSWYLASPGESRDRHKRIAKGVGSVNAIAVAGLWIASSFILDELAQTPVVLRLGVAAVLGCGAGGAALALSLIGQDARSTTG